MFAHWQQLPESLGTCWKLQLKGVPSPLQLFPGQLLSQSAPGLSPHRPGTTNRGRDRETRTPESRFPCVRQSQWLPTYISFLEHSTGTVAQVGKVPAAQPREPEFNPCTHLKARCNIASLKSQHGGGGGWRMLGCTDHLT